MSYDELADLYALQYENYTGDLDFYARLAGRHGGPVLELGAGQGRVAAHLARRGVEVWALEPSAAMRRRGEVATRGLPVRWIAGDMRDFELGRRFPLVIAPFNALMHLYTLADQDAALARAVRHLDAGGVFAFDLYNPLQIHADAALRLEGRYGRTEVYYRQEHHPATQRLTTHYVIDETGPDGALKRRHNRLDQRYFTRYEIERWLAAAGLSGRLAGGFQGEPFTATSPVMVWTARRVS
ncbi:class I SAM-dependent methyltransferase [Oceanithermus profundus]